MILNSILFFILCYHLLWASFELLVHRSLMHGHYTIDKRLYAVLRFNVWLLMGLAFKNWEQHLCALHRKHHRFSDQPEDPVSPHCQTFRQLFDYKHNDPKKPRYIGPEDLAKYAPEVNSDNSNLEINFYQRYPKFGLTLMWALYTVLFGIPGFIVGAIHRFLITEIILLNADWGTHKIGFRYVKLPYPDKAVNLFPIGILMAGEELHANHHLEPSRLNYAMRWFEFDLGFWYARLFIFLGLMQVKKIN